MNSAQAVVTHAHGVVQQIAIQRQPAADALARVQGGYDALVADLDSYRQLNIQTDQELALTSETLWQDVHETLDYEVFEWTRTCAAPVSVSMRAGWRTELPTSERYSPSVATQDSSHIGHELAQLTEDPKAYPDQDADLLARVDGATATEISAWLARMVEDYYETRTLETTMSMQKEPLRGADRLLGLYVGAPAHVDEATRLTFSSHARQHFGVERLELLRANDDGQVAHN